ncbi:MAG TPA: alkaline phosphatase family protein [Candidatus Angelobacter sp.]|nr:alkaline phosphatase family protein [Candidatus Angelobacter sp.]
MILFITDGLRHDAINADTAPAIEALRRRGVDFRNSHSLFPTVTTANASAFATGHQLGDTGNFANVVYVDRPVATDEKGVQLSWTPFLENNFVLAGLNAHYKGSYLGVAETLEELARKHCYATVVVGKNGPVGIQAISQLGLERDEKAKKNRLRKTVSPIIEDVTGKDAGALVPDEFQDDLSRSGLSSIAPDRNNWQAKESPGDNGYSGTFTQQGTLAANVNQQQYFTNAVTQVILPAIARKKKPFLLIFWSRDPDGSQHNQGDSLNRLQPGINHSTSLKAIHNADDNLRQIMDYLQHTGCQTGGRNCLDAMTDVIVAADHGFSTISKGGNRPEGGCSIAAALATSLKYSDVSKGCLPPGFLAIDLAMHFAELSRTMGDDFKLKLYDPDTVEPPSPPQLDPAYRTVFDPDTRSGAEFAQHPKLGNALLGGDGKPPKDTDTKTDAQIIITANGGSALIYLPQNNQAKNAKFARLICKFLLDRQYVNGLFVDDSLGEIPGALLFSKIGLGEGTAKLPKPAIIVNFASFTLPAPPDSKLAGFPLLWRVEVADSNLQQGQGNHGNFSRADTYNAMVAVGPDFKKNYPDYAPVSNADIAVTIAYMLNWDRQSEPELPHDHGKNQPPLLRGRVMKEALKQGPVGPSSLPVSKSESSSEDSDTKKVTSLMFQEFDGRRYCDEACLVLPGEKCK